MFSSFRKNSLLHHRDGQAEASFLEPDEGANGAQRSLSGL
jgi:hypothetical protein